MSLSEKLKELRKDKGLTQKQLAAATGLSIASIISYENGLREPNFKALTVLEEYFGVSGEYLNGTISKKDYLKLQKDVQANLDEVYDSMKRFTATMAILDSNQQIYVTELFNEFLSYVSNKQMVDFDNHTELALLSAYIALNEIGKKELVNRGIEMSEISRFSKND